MYEMALEMAGEGTPMTTSAKELLDVAIERVELGKTRCTVTSIEPPIGAPAPAAARKGGGIDIGSSTTARVPAVAPAAVSSHPVAAPPPATSESFKGKASVTNPVPDYVFRSELVNPRAVSDELRNEIFVPPGGDAEVNNWEEKFHMLVDQNVGVPSDYVQQGVTRDVKEGDIMWGPRIPAITPTLKEKGTNLLTNNWFMFMVTAFGLQTGNQSGREWEMTPIGANSDWNVLHDNDDFYGKSFRLQINNYKNRIWYRILDPSKPAKPALKDTPEKNAFMHAKRMVHQWDDEILDFKYGSMPLHGPLRGWLVASPLCLDDGEWRSPDAWKTRPLAQSAELEDTPAGKRLLESAKMFRMDCSAEELAAANKVKEGRTNGEAQEPAKRQKK